MIEILKEVKMVEFFDCLSQKIGEYNNFIQVEDLKTGEIFAVNKNKIFVREVEDYKKDTPQKKLVCWALH